MQELQEIEKPTKFIANQAQGIKNYLDGTKLREILVDTLNEIYTILQDHAGYNASHAMIISETGTDFKPNIFTKDGIGILSSIEYASPIQSYIKDVITHVGRKVDSVAKDGTTTSMLLTVNYLVRILQEIENSGYVDNVNVIRDVFEKVIATKLTAKDNGTITVSTLAKDLNITERQARKFIAFMQAMSSSGGDIELAKVVSEMLYLIPSNDVLGQLKTTQSVTEQKQRFILETTDGDYTVFANPLIAGFYNQVLGTQYKVENATVIPLPDNVTNGSILEDKLIRYIMNVEDKPVVLVSGTLPANTISAIVEVNKSRSNKIVAFSDLDTGTDNPHSQLIFANVFGLGLASDCQFYTDVVATMGSASDELDDTIYGFKAGEVKYLGNYLHISNFYADNDSLHPFFVDPDRSPDYTQFIKDLDTIITQATHHHVTRSELIDKAWRIKNQMIMKRCPVLYIGGSTHENIANKAVVQDVLGAVISSLTEGFIPAGLFWFNTKLEKDEENINILEYSPYDVFTFFLDLTIKDILSIIMDENEVPYIREATEYVNSNVGEVNTLSKYYQTYQSYGINEDVSLNDIMNYPPVQPTMIYEEIFKRLLELIPKLVTTSKVIVPNGVFVDQDK